MTEISVASNFTYIDLFAGCGGLSLGLHKAGWKGLFAIEKSPDAFHTLEHNLIDKVSHFDWPAWLPKTNHEIDEILNVYGAILKELRGQVDLVVGGPPCQGFSCAGRRREDDVRNGLIKSYLRFIMHVRPKLILFENVTGFTQKFEKNKSKGIAYSHYVLRVLKAFGYEVEGRMIDFSEYGIPQKRTRFILVGIQKEIAEQHNIEVGRFFEQLAGNKRLFLQGKNLPLNPNVGSAISDLLKENGIEKCPDRKGFSTSTYSHCRSKYQKYLRTGYDLSLPNSHSFANHMPDTVKRNKYYLKSQIADKKISRKEREKFNTNKQTIVVLSAKAPSRTITSLPDDFIHYCEPRILTVRECARIQSFPDWFEFKGKYTTGGKRRKHEVPRYTQVGNAIPPLFGEQSGLVLKRLIS